MTPADFTAALRQELHLRGVPFDGGALAAFAASVWPLVDDDALVDVGRWAPARRGRRWRNSPLPRWTSIFCRDASPPDTR